MKQLKTMLALLLVLCLALSLSACGSKEAPAPAATEAPTEAPAEEPEAPAEEPEAPAEEPEAPAEEAEAPAEEPEEPADEPAEASVAEDPYANAASDPYSAAASDPYSAAASDPYSAAASDPYSAAASDPYAAAANDPYSAAASDPYSAAANDPYAAAANDPYSAAANDPYAGAANDPYAAAASDPYSAAANDPYAGAANDPYAQTDAEPVEEAASGDYMPEPGPDSKWIATETADGWVKIEQEGGETLGLSKTSGVKIVEDDGFAFKDLNQNGGLDAYEDWRLDTETRAQALVELMSGAEEAAILSHGGWGAPTGDPLATDGSDTSYTYLIAGGRGGVTRNIGLGGAAHAKWTNQIQAVAESCWYGIPAMISIDPANISGVVESVALASTMDPELAAKIGQETAKEYRAAGVTALLGPQVDIASPVMFRAGGTYGEDPQLTLDIATAYVNAMQSTYDENGEDLGWGNESVYCFTKHYGGAGSTEGGRDDHGQSGRYAVFPGDNLEAHLITYFDGVFNLPGKTGSSGIMTEYAINVAANGEPIGGEWAGAYNPYMKGLLDLAGYDSLKITDWAVFENCGSWGSEAMADAAERIAYCWQNGTVELLGGYGDQESVARAYEILVGNVGEEEAEKLVDKYAYDYAVVMMNLGMFEQPYNDSAYAESIISTGKASELGMESQRASVVMLKNSNNVIAQKEAPAEKPTVYVPYVYTTGASVTWMAGIVTGPGSWSPSMDLEKLGEYFNVVTDTPADPTGPADADGNPTYTSTDIVRATPEEIQACDYILVGMTNAFTTSYNKNYIGGFQYASAYKAGAVFTDDDEYYPASLQYAEYTADTAREVSISGMINPATGAKQNRSYKGKTAAQDANYGHLEALQYAKENAGSVPVIVSMKMERGMIWSEVEPLADAILVCYQSQKPEVVSEIILGQTEPSGLLCFQQPADMLTVEAQLEDVPRDMTCYVDAAGNAYDFAFGMNWAGVISDARTEKYSAAPISKIQNIDYATYKAANYPVIEEAAPAEEAPAEEAPAEDAEAPAEDAPAEDAEAPAEDAPAEDAPAEDAEAPAEDAPAEDAPAEDAEAPAEEPAPEA